MVIVYTKDNCSKCKSTKMVLDLLRVDVTYKNLGEQEILELASELDVDNIELPIVLKDDIVIAIGFSPELLANEFC